MLCPLLAASWAELPPCAADAPVPCAAQLPPETARGDWNFADVDGYWRAAIGARRSLPALRVSYGHMRLRGGGSHFNNTRDEFLRSAPSIEWPASVGQATVLMVDLDAGGRRVDPSQHGANAPFLHAAWTGCRDGSVERCDIAVPYLSPGVWRTTNRYAFLLLAQPEPLRAAVLAPTASRARWDLARFVADNPTMRPLRQNFMHVTGYGRVTKHHR